VRKARRPCALSVGDQSARPVARGRCAARYGRCCDLYPFCANVSDGKTIALGNPNAKQLIGTDGRVLKDATGKAFGEELFAAGQKPDGQITEVSYMFVKPGPDKTPVPKVSFVTRAGDIYCGVGYYK
jgi:hypothetical protein